MDTQRSSNGWQTFIEHWGFALLTLMAVGSSQLLIFFTHLSGLPWMACYGMAIAIGVAGAGLLFYAKLPLYRERRFLTIGAQALPKERRRFYRWGRRCAVFSMVLLACLLLSRH